MKCKRINRLTIGVMTLLVVGSVVAGAPGQTVDRFFAAYEARSIDDMLALYAPDAVFEDVSQRHEVSGRDALRGMLANLVGAHHAMRVVEKRRVVRGNTVVVEFEYAGQLNGAVLGAAVGKEGCPDLEYTIPATSWFEIASDRIVRQRDFIDYATYLELQKKMLAAGSDTH